MRVIIFGTGKGGQNTLQLFLNQQGHEVVCLMDNNAALWGSMHEGLEIKGPDTLSSLSFDQVIIASQYHKEIKPQLLSLGIPEEKVFVAHHNMMNGYSLEFGIFTGYPQGKAPDIHTYFSFREDVLRTLAMQVELVMANQVVGSIAEFGCGTGQSSYMLARTVRDCSQYYNMPAKHLHLFDSFEGLPPSYHDVDKESPLVQSNVWQEGACADISAQQLANTLENQLHFSDYSIYQGWFADTLVQIPTSERFALVHLDCDLYESTYQVLEYLFTQKLISDGAILLFDDWSCNENKSAYGQQKAWSDICEKFDISFDDRGYYGLGSHIISIKDYKAYTDTLV
ncbi:hypothetical protein CWB89_15385 [Pseudoalteromonas piscicida]|uniref:Class I SAM-dependent methyltransferase n=1 Tax=Pseudoalteromonas piscicida TaxID=43662 RepID=A0AAQ2IQL3_PSEO7|nr:MULTISPECIES: TylF/MycF/NovP-related O-methyltransferase [Pseudoalteromonas]KJY92896.1 hypothetical protein TW75_01000 [Pseudoalteromonas piscicida]TMN39612.1 hypothetical protein CWB95_12350 [Pseudoalteromonas piscicida]TMN41017.1 hypothetical protein CWB94_08320 [Pseudoalteromonas piscicida]TMN49436.1 hypothetical protein CWB92_15375 [Pseudoalteromonas piscicida]TMN51527.1 hypothetical protein CWB91_12650 [Pseudoalteromonas piscicida]